MINITISNTIMLIPYPLSDCHTSGQDITQTTHSAGFLRASCPRSGCSLSSEYDSTSNTRDAPTFILGRSAAHVFCVQLFDSGPSRGKWEAEGKGGIKGG